MNKFHAILDEVSEKAGWSDDTRINILCEYLNSLRIENLAPLPSDFRQYIETLHEEELKAHEGC